MYKTSYEKHKLSIIHSTIYSWSSYYFRVSSAVFSHHFTFNLVSANLKINANDHIMKRQVFDLEVMSAPSTITSTVKNYH